MFVVGAGTSLWDASSERSAQNERACAAFFSSQEGEQLTRDWREAANFYDGATLSNMTVEVEYGFDESQLFPTSRLLVDDTAIAECPLFERDR